MDFRANTFPLPRATITLVCSFILGIFLETYFRPSDSATFGALLICLGLFLSGFYYWTRRHMVVVMLSAALLGLGLGVVRTIPTDIEDTTRLLTAFEGTEVVIVGVVRAEPDMREAHTNLTIQTETVNDMAFQTRVLVRTERFPTFSYGDKLEVRGKLDTPKAFETDLERTFDYRGYLSARGISHTIAFAKINLLSRNKGNVLITQLLKLKNMFMQNIESALPEPSAGLAEGITLGVKRALGTELEVAFRKTGIIHIVVLSGYNVSIVAEAIMRLLSAFLMPKTRAVLGALAIAAFALIAGLSATVLRASLMATLILYARASGNTHSAMRALVFAAVIMLLLNPQLLLYDPGFQLSFLATAGLILLSPHIEARLFRVPSLFQIREFVTATLSTQIFILPFLLFAIGEFSLVSVLVNVLVLPVVPLAMLGTFFVGVLGMISKLLALTVALPTHLLLSYIVFVAQWFSSLPFAALPVPPFPFSVVILAYAVMIAWLYGSYNKKITQQLQ